MLDGVSSGEGLITAGNVDWTDYTVETDMRIVADSGQNEATVLVRYVDANNYYWLGLGCWGHRVSISRTIAGVAEEQAFAGDISEVIADKTYHLKVECQGNSLRLYVDGILELEVQDVAFPNGAIGYRTYNSHIEADYIHAYAPTPQLLATLGGAGIGATIGYALSPKDPLVFMLAGALAGGALGLIVDQALE